MVFKKFKLPQDFAIFPKNVFVKNKRMKPCKYSGLSVVVAAAWGGRGRRFKSCIPD
jgi:hypothetical protein